VFGVWCLVLVLGVCGLVEEVRMWSVDNAGCWRLVEVVDVGSFVLGVVA
jgi:hypothetical protein